MAKKPKVTTFVREVLATEGTSPHRVFVDAVQDARDRVARGCDDEEVQCLAAQSTFEQHEIPGRITKRTRRALADAELRARVRAETVYGPAGIMDMGLERAYDGHWKRRWLIYGHGLI